MPNTAIVELVEPLLGHGEPIRRLVLKEPTGRDYISLGEPMVVARNPDGTAYAVENTAVIEQYVERCITEPKDPLLVIPQLGLSDAMRLKEAVLGFFRDARQAASSA